MWNISWLAALFLLRECILTSCNILYKTELVLRVTQMEGVGARWPFYIETSLIISHCNDVIMSVMVSQIAGCLRYHFFRRRSKKTWNSMSLFFVRGIHRWPVDSPHNGPVTRKMFPFDDVIMVKPRCLVGVLDRVPLSTTDVKDVCANIRVSSYRHVRKISP